MQNIGEIIRKFRRMKGIKQKELAKNADMRSSSLCDIEKGRVNPSLQSLYKIASALDEPLSSFFQEDKSDIPQGRSGDLMNKNVSHYVIMREEIERKRKELHSMYKNISNLKEEELLKKSRELDDLIKKLYGKDQL